MKRPATQKQHFDAQFSRQRSNNLLLGIIAYFDLSISRYSEEDNISVTGHWSCD
jgi:hypothetical protein